jgi:lipopolysaccharide/colanic/teichoic acid biosynthesis glycosyltransferase
MTRLARPFLFLGIAIVVVSLSKLHASTLADPVYDYTGSFRFLWSLAFIGMLAIAAYGAGLPDLPRSRRSAVTAALAAASGGAIAISVVQLFVGDALLPRFVVFGSALLLVPWYLLCVAVATGGRLRAEERDRVVVVASPDEVEALRLELARSAERPATVVGALVVEQAQSRNLTSKPLCEEVLRQRASVLVLDRSAQEEPTVVTQAASLHEAGVRVRTLSLFYDQWLGKLPVSELERVGLMFDIGEVHRARYGRMKRVVDIAFALAALPVLVLVMPVVFLGNLAANRGPLFYRQQRHGKGGTPFAILKFRTMRAAAPDALVNEWTSEDDPRITSFGRILRTSHLDELPQIVNILRGDLSIVGPRPEQPAYVAELVRKLPFYDLRHVVRPGLTGWAQVKYGYAGDERDALEKLQYDFYYLRWQDIRLDLRILGRTVRSVAGRQGR